MKRRDWKIKKLKKNIYDKLYKRRTIFFLRRLFLRKNLVLIKKNLIPQFIFYNNLIKTFYFKKNINFNKIHCLDSFNYLCVLPNFFLQKNIFKNFFLFKNLIKINNFDFFFNSKLFHNTLKGNNIIVFNSNDNNIILDSKAENISKIDQENNKNIIFTVKTNYCVKKTNLNKIINFFINYNLHLFCNLEIYKIIIVLYISKLK